MNNKSKFFIMPNVGVGRETMYLLATPQERGGSRKWLFSSNFFDAAFFDSHEEVEEAIDKNGMRNNCKVSGITEKELFARRLSGQAWIF